MVSATTSSDHTSLGYALGRLAGAIRFSSSKIRNVARLAIVADAWCAYRRDAGIGDVGPARQPSTDALSVLLTGDPRRDAVVLWLAAHGVPAIADAATAVVRMPSQSIRHYVASEPAGCWALNLVLVARGIVLPVTGLVPRTVFRLDLADAERAAALVDHSVVKCWPRLRTSSGWSRRWVAVATPLLAYHATPERLRPGLLVVLGPTTRKQLTHALGLSRAGADIQARALAAAGLVVLETGGLVTPALPGSPTSPSASLDHGPRCAAAADLNVAVAEIDRLLTRGLDQRN